MRPIAAVLAVLLMLPAPARAEGVTLGLKESCTWPAPSRNVVHGTFEGRAAIRFNLAPGDTGTCPADVRRGGYNRAEYRGIDNLPRDRDLRVSFDVFIPKDIAATGDIAFGQFHQTNASPLILLMVSGTRYRASVGSGLRELGARLPLRENLLEASDFGRWQTIEMAARFSRGDDGYIRVKVNGAVRFETTGRTVKTEPYFKIGLYGRRDRMAGPLTVYATEPVLTVE